ncbi:MAG: non-canonical purine NTP pyrophosphatase [Candidatus Curtissbacteria bacterium]|nr:non-canonical purine NTP pyrophosphatase [Candidatus Curtissbacteria bacterium]
MNLSDLVVVTSNRNKIAEINAILGTNHKVSKINIPEIQSMNIDKVITAKAKSAFEKIQKPVLVEDVSVDIKELRGLPGPFIKFFLETLGTEGVAKLTTGKKPEATVTAAIAIYDGKNLKIFKSQVSGTITKKDRGVGGFGFDRIFIPNGYKQTYSEMPQELKNKISHRSKALKKVAAYLNNSVDK